MIYRREIDGLRAVAVVPVILFHAGFNGLSGGYVGVDVFFVISGYLITTILIGELEQGNFTIARFYEGRARRILPALFFVMLCCIPFAWLWMLPSELKDFSQSVVSVVFFVSNFLFWREQGYFAPAAEIKPMLHTWSLAVEGQYYLLFPIFLMLAWRFGRKRVFWSICVIAAISLAANEWGWRNKPSANFYLAPTRAWEFLVGSMCAFWLSNRQQLPNSWLSSIGLTLILFAIICYDDTTPVPSVYALAPVLGSALFIVYGGAGTWTAKLLSLRAFTGLGLISYSAYLWHQPLFAFARIRSIPEPAPHLMAALAVLSFVLAYVSWRYIEKPFRNNHSPILPTRLAVFAASGGVAAAFVAVGLVGYFSDGFPKRFDRQILTFQMAKEDRADMTCHFGEGRILPVHPERACIEKFFNSDPVFLLGDSHAAAISGALKKELTLKKISYYNITYSGCPPLVGFKIFNNNVDENCEKFNLGVINFAKSIKSKTLVLTARFPLYLLGQRYDNGEGGIERDSCVAMDLDSRESSECNDPRRRLRVIKAYEKSIRDLSSQFNVVLVYPIPEAGWDVPNYRLRKLIFTGEGGTLTTSYKRYKDRSREVTELFDRLSHELPNVYVARVDKALCSEKTGRCLNADDSGVYYFDDDHLSNAGARLVAPVIADAIMAANAGAR